MLNLLRVPSNAGKSFSALSEILFLQNLGVQPRGDDADRVISVGFDLSEGPCRVIGRVSVKSGCRRATSQLAHLRDEYLLLSRPHVLVSEEDHSPLRDWGRPLVRILKP